MIQLLVRLVTAPDRVHDVVHALRAVMRPALQLRGCSFAHVYHSAVDPGRILYVEEWEDEQELRAQLGSIRLVRLMELLESAEERPVVEFRFVSGMRGLDWIAEQREPLRNSG